MDAGNDEFGMFVRTEVPEEEGCFDPQNKLWWDRATNRPVITHSPGTDPFLLGTFALSDGTAVKPAFQLLKERVDEYTPEWAAGITGIPAEAIRRLAHEMGVTARDQKIEIADSVDRRLGQRARDASPATRWRFTRCAASPRIRTDFTPSARSRS